MLLSLAGIVMYGEWFTWPLLLSLPAQIMNPPAGYFLFMSWRGLTSLLDVELHFACWLFWVGILTVLPIKTLIHLAEKLSLKKNHFPISVPAVYEGKIFNPLWFFIVFTPWLLGYQLAVQHLPSLDASLWDLQGRMSRSSRRFSESGPPASGHDSLVPAHL